MTARKTLFVILGILMILAGIQSIFSVNTEKQRRHGAPSAAAFFLLYKLAVLPLRDKSFSQGGKSFFLWGRTHLTGPGADAIVVSGTVRKGDREHEVFG